MSDSACAARVAGNRPASRAIVQTAGVQGSIHAVCSVCCVSDGRATETAVSERVLLVKLSYSLVAHSVTNSFIPYS